MQDNTGDSGAIREATDDLSKLLFEDKASASVYGEHYQAHLLEQYKLYVQMADKISERRQSANNFFLTINTALIALVGLVAGPDVGSNPSVASNPPLPWVLVVSGAGVVLSYTWYRLVLSYDGLNRGKFKVVHAIESKLPASPYDAEWEVVGKGENPRLYLPFTHVEIRIPWVFAFLYATFAGWNILQAAFLN